MYLLDLVFKQLKNKIKTQTKTISLFTEFNLITNKEFITNKHSNNYDNNKYNKKLIKLTKQQKQNVIN